MQLTENYAIKQEGAEWQEVSREFIEDYGTTTNKIPYPTPHFYDNRSFLVGKDGTKYGHQTFSLGYKTDGFCSVDDLRVNQSLLTAMIRGIYNQRTSYNEVWIEREGIEKSLRYDETGNPNAVVYRVRGCWVPLDNLILYPEGSLYS